MKINELIQTDYDFKIKDVCYNSKNVTSGSLFVAIKGFQTDGHKYIEDAQTRGAAGVVCEEPAEGVAIPQIVVPNSRLALAQISDRFYGRPAKDMKLIGITGTNGKTTVTYLVKSILEAAGNKVGLIGTNQNMIGNEALETGRTTPESLELSKLFTQMRDGGCNYVVMEVSSHSLALDRVGACQFEVGAFTNLTQDHLDFHETMDNYMLAKLKLFFISRNAVINSDDEYGQSMLQLVKCPVTSYGIEHGNLMAQNIQLYADGISFDVGEDKFILAIPGRFTVYNALCAIGIAKALGIEMQTIKLGLSTAMGVKGRVEVVPSDRDFTMIIDYAHTPDGLYNLLTTVRDFAPGRVVVVFGCGGDRDKRKRPVMGKIAGELADLCIVTSDNPRTEDPKEIIRDILDGMRDSVAEYVVVENRRDAIEYAIRQAKPGDVILFAGKGHETYQIFADKTIHFDEREVIAEVLRSE